MITSPTLKKRNQLSAKKYVEWINQILNTNIKSIVELRSGYEFGQILRKTFGDRVKMKILKKGNQFGQKNFQILEDAVRKLDWKDDKPVNLHQLADIDGAVVGRFKDLYRLTFFFHELYTFNTKNDSGEGNAILPKQSDISILTGPNFEDIENKVHWVVDFQKRHENDNDQYLINHVEGFRKEFNDKRGMLENIKTDIESKRETYLKAFSEYEECINSSKTFVKQFTGRLDAFISTSKNFYK